MNCVIPIRIVKTEIIMFEKRDALSTNVSNKHDGIWFHLALIRVHGGQTKFSFN